MRLACYLRCSLQRARCCGHVWCRRNRERLVDFLDRRQKICDVDAEDVSSGVYLVEKDAVLTALDVADASPRDLEGRAQNMLPASAPVCPSCLPQTFPERGLHSLAEDNQLGAPPLRHVRREWRARKGFVKSRALCASELIAHLVRVAGVVDLVSLSLICASRAPTLRRSPAARIAQDMEASMGTTMDEGAVTAGAHGGGEHRHSITIDINGKAVTTTQRELTGLEIKALGSVPADYELFMVRDGKSVPVTNEERVRLHEHEQFRAIPSGTFGGGRRAAACPR